MIELPYSHLNSDDLAEFAGPNGFYGFGNLTRCKYLFIGPEFGGSASSFETKARVDAWKALTSSMEPCVDARKFHHRIEEYRWFGPPNPQPNQEVKRQPTYARLIELIPGIWDEEDDRRKRKSRDYQHDEFGKLDGENCFIEVSAIQRPSTNEDTFVKHIVGESVYEKWKTERAKRILEFIRDNKERGLSLVVVYGQAKRHLDVEELRKAYPHVIIVDHPTSRGGLEYWKNKASEIAKLLNNHASR